MEARSLKMINEIIRLGPSFEEVTVKEEPQDVKEESAESTTASTSRKRSKLDSGTDIAKQHSRHQSSKTTVRMRSQYTQVMPEDIDCCSTIKFNQQWDKAIDPANLGEIVPQCRLCLRRMPRDNLEIIVSEHKKKVRFAFQLRIFPHDAYPFICAICSTLMDIIIDFKHAVTQSKCLLIQKHAHLERDGWDDPDYVNALHKCKSAVGIHRKQIDTMFEQMIIPGKECISHTVGNRPQNSGLANSTTAEENFVIKKVDPSLTDAIPKVEIKKQATERETASKGFIADDSTDEEFLPHDDGADDEIEIKIKKPRRAKIQRSKTKNNEAENTTSYKQSVLRQLCDFCGASVRPESVESHKNGHLGIRPYACSVEECKLTFTSRFNLGKHIKRMHKEREVHTCNMCGKQIRGSIAVLKYHQQRHNVDEKKYICQVCGKGFTMKWYLTQHSIIHSGVFPHKCKYCGKKFNNKWSMKTHEKKIHEKKADIKNEDNVALGPEKTLNETNMQTQ